MSKLSERKVLKKVLANLKSKSISSNTIRKEIVTTTLKDINSAWVELGKETWKKNPTLKLGLTALIQHVELLIEKLVSRSEMAVNDMEIYVDALERYSTNLDSTLTKIFQRAIKKAEEEIKRQRELMKRKPPKTMVV